MSTVNGSWARPKIVNDGLVLYLDANAPNSYSQYFTPTTWKDLSGNNNNGTFINGPTFSSEDGGSILFDGTNDYVDVSTFNQTFTTLTLSCWIKIPSIQADWAGVMYSRGVTADTVTGMSFVSTLSGENKLGINYNDTNFGWTGGPTVATGSWTCVDLTFSSTLATYYINGNFYSSTSNLATGTTLSSLRLGYDGENASRVLRGNMGQASIYNRALTAQEVLQNYNATKSRYGL